MEDRDFRERVIQDLTTLVTKMGAVEKHLETLNSKVATHEKEIFEQRLRLKERENQCPLVDMLEKRVQETESFVSDQTAASKQNSAWFKRLKPATDIIIIAILFLLLQHAPDILALIKKL